MGPKPTAVDQAGRPPRKLWAVTRGFQTVAQEVTSYPVREMMFMTSCVLKDSVVITTPEFEACEMSALMTPGVSVSALVTRPEQPPQLIPMMFRV